MILTVTLFYPFLRLKDRYFVLILDNWKSCKGYGRLLKKSTGIVQLYFPLYLYRFTQQFGFWVTMGETEKPASNIYTFKDEKPAKFDTQYTPSIRDQHIPLVIDNGKLSFWNSESCDKYVTMSFVKWAVVTLKVLTIYFVSLNW